ncbi:MAG: MoaD/ThiS family protein [Dehalococcoidia bacterium]|nr:MoaD/ThiS family protein [Dehalococcoidia bacterium]
MEMTVKVFGLTDAISASTVKMKLRDEATVSDMLEELIAQYGDGLRERLLKGDQLDESIYVVVGEETVDRLEHPLKGQTQAFILQVIPGG